MKIYIMTYEAIKYIKNNIKYLVDFYKNGVRPEVWLKGKIESSPFVEVPDLEFEDFELFIDEDKPSSTDIANIKLFYSKTKDLLNDSFATDERLWAGLCHTVFYDYMLKRWSFDFDEKKIINNFFIRSTRYYNINTIARLWWYGRKTYSKKFVNNFAILDYIANDINGYAFTLFGSNWSNSERTLEMFFEVLFELEKEFKLDRTLFNDTIQYINALCGIYLVDVCDDAFIKEKIKVFIYERRESILLEREENKIKNIKTTGIARLDNIIKAINFQGGHATAKEIFNAFEIISQKQISVSDKNYIKTQLDQKENRDKFIPTKIFGNHGYRVSVAFLATENQQNRKNFVLENVHSLEETDKTIFNCVSALKKNKFSLADLMLFEQQLSSYFPEVQHIGNFVKGCLKRLVELGIVEQIDNEFYKKTFIFS